MAGWRYKEDPGSGPRANISKIVNGFPKVRMTDIDKATKNLLDWTDTDEWAPRLFEVHMNHLDLVADIFDVDEHELMETLSDGADMLNPFIIEDFFTARFGEHGELNVIDDYLERRGWRESDSARRYLEALRDSTPSLYEVVDIDPGRSLTVRDLLVPGAEVTVQEQSGSKAASPWDRLAARIVTMNEKRVFTGAVLPFRPDATDHVLSAFDRMVKEETKAFRKKFRRAAGTGRKRRRRSAAVPPRLREEIIRSLPCAKIFTHFWIADFLSRVLAPLPELRNTDDEAMVFCEVRFPTIGDEARISALLDGIEWFERDADGEAHWTWCAPGSPTHRLARVRGRDPVAASENAIATTNLGDARIGAGVLTLSVNSRERAERGQELLSSRLGDLVGPALISSQDPYQALRAHRAEPTQNDKKSASAEEVQAIHLFLDGHYRHTLDEPLPVLGGKTLRQAVTTNKGRKQAVDWLKQLENMEHRRAAEQGHKAYDTGWIWQELGIERPR